MWLMLQLDLSITVSHNVIFVIVKRNTYTVKKFLTIISATYVHNEDNLKL